MLAIFIRPRFVACDVGRIGRYRLLRISREPDSPGHAILYCLGCGPAEFIADSSSLLQSLEWSRLTAGGCDSLDEAEVRVCRIHDRPRDCQRSGRRWRRHIEHVQHPVRQYKLKIVRQSAIPLERLRAYTGIAGY